MEVLGVKGSKTSVMKRIRERGMKSLKDLKEQGLTQRDVLPFRFRKTITVKPSPYVQELKEDMYKLKNVFIEVKEEKTKTIIRMGFNSKKTMNPILEKYFHISVLPFPN